MNGWRVWRKVLGLLASGMVHADVHYSSAGQRPRQLKPALAPVLKQQLVSVKWTAAASLTNLRSLSHPLLDTRPLIFSRFCGLGLPSHEVTRYAIHLLKIFLPFLGRDGHRRARI
jgi:hypothetical protein